MSETKICLDSESKLNEFLKITEKYNIPVYALTPQGSRVNARGTLGLLSLDLAQPITIVTDTVNQDTLEFFDAISKFIV